MQPEAVIEKDGNLSLPVQLVNAEAIEMEAYRLNDTQLRAGLYAAQQSVGSESWKSSLLPLKSARVASWVERPGCPGQARPVQHSAPLAGAAARCLVPIC